jgi:hypothetical protein
MAGRYTGSYLDQRNGWRTVAILAGIGQASLVERILIATIRALAEPGQERDAEHFDHRSQSRAWIGVRSAVRGRGLASLRDVS